MAYTVLAILLTAAFSQFYKIANRKRCDIFAVNLGCYLAAIVLVAAYVILVEGFLFEAKMVAIAVSGSVCVFGAVVTFFFAMRIGKLSIGWTIVGVSCCIPVLVSFVIWDEPMTPQKVVGLVLAAAAVLLLDMDQRRGAGR